MEPKFIHVGSGDDVVVLDMNHISSVRFYENNAVVFMKSGFNHEFSGENAQALRQFFRPIDQGAKDGEAAPGV